MKLINFFIYMALCLFLIGCTGNPSEMPQNVSSNKPEETKGTIYEGTYSFYYNEYFIEGKSGHLWRPYLSERLKTDFKQHWNKATGNKRPPNIARVRFKGTIKWINDNPPVGIKVSKNSNKFVPYKHFTVTEVISVTVPDKLNPATCYREEIPCSSAGLAQFSGKVIKH